MEAPIAAMSDVGNNNKHVEAVRPIPNFKDNNADSRMNTSSKNNAATTILEKVFSAANEKPAPSQETQDSQSTVEGSNDTTVSTPPTSEGDAFSSQSQESQPSQAAAVDAASLSSGVAAGQKRTASGLVKSSGGKSPTSPVLGNNVEHSRSVSNISSIRIGELSDELRTRLSYAMLKVKNGWQSLPIDEVESLASQAGSPTSSTSTIQGRRNRITSPRATIASHQSESRPFSSSAPVLGASNSLASLTTGDQPSRTYESFWREHSANANPTHRHSPFHPNSSLAPPVDFPLHSSHSSTRNPVLHHPRRSNGNNQSRPFRPPILPIHTVSDLSQYSTTSPHTPNKDPAIDAMLHTPSQKSIQEQDAIESLLFMSSPGNSTKLLHTFPPPIPTSNQQSPLRSEFNAATGISSSQPNQSNRNGINNVIHRERSKKVGFSRTEEEDSSEGGGYSMSRAPSNGEPRSKRRSRDADELDRMLDEMGSREEMGSSDDEAVELVTSARRRAVGRVG